MGRTSLLYGFLILFVMIAYVIVTYIVKGRVAGRFPSNGVTILFWIVSFAVLNFILMFLLSFNVLASLIYSGAGIIGGASIGVREVRRKKGQ